MKKTLCSAFAAFALGLFSIGQVWANGIVISEFMALNVNAHTDEDGDYPDWIELFNAGATDVDLDDWYLTDHQANLTMWRFPAVTLRAGRYLVVYASEKDKRDPSGRLHTNFKLTSEGEYLALVEPDGATIAFDFGDQYPPQAEDFSFGLEQGAAVRTVVASSAAARTLVPTNGSLGRTWTQASFDHAGWVRGDTGVGYEGGAGYESLIRTDLASRMRSKNTTAYIRIPFWVDDASNVSAVLFRIKYDDGYVAYLNGTEIASGNAPANPSWDSSATSLHDDGAAVVFEEPPVPGAASRLRTGNNVLAIHGLNDNLGSSDFLILPELDLVDAGGLDLENTGFFARPSPGGPNFAGAPGVSPTPVISRPGGTITSSVSVELSVDSPVAVIRYTTDGSEPGAASRRYFGPFSVTTTTQLNVRSFVPGFLPSPLVTESYLYLSAGVRGFTSDVPIVVIETFGKSIGGGSHTPAFTTVIDVDRSGRSSIAGVPDFQGHSGLKERGSSSLGFPKKQWAFEVWNRARGNDMDAEILGFAADSDWILYAPYSDKSLMRNVLSYDWSNRIDRYAVRTRFVEVFLNTNGGRLSSGDYHGVYVFMEKIKRNSERVDIARLLGSDNSGEEVTGGYILKVDRLDPGDSGFTTNGGLRLAHVYPKEDRISRAQLSYIRGYLNQFEAALYGGNFRDPVNGYRKYIDVDSFIDHHIMVEITKNIDGFRLSTFMYKDKNGKLTMGPIWDYNLTLGNADYLTGWRTSGWYSDLVGANDYAWYSRLFQDADFQQRYTDRWTQFRENQFALGDLQASVDGNVRVLEESAERNFDEWNILGTRVWPNWFIAHTWIEEVDWMKGWIDGRVAWIDSQYAGPPFFNRESGLVPPGFDLTITAPQTTIYYTLDGTDPRKSGGGIAASARRYQGSLTINENTRVIARVRRRQSRWSAPRDATFYTELPNLAISEIMYHPADAAGRFSASDFEFVEVVNIGSQAVSLDGIRFDTAVRFDFTTGGVRALEPGEYAVVVKDFDAFNSRYDTSAMNIAGVYDGNLSNGGEALRLLGPGDLVLREMAFSDTWYPETDGDGFSLVIVDAWGTGDRWSQAASWRRSSDLGGSPGEADRGAILRGDRLPGDSNQDGLVDVADALSLLLHLFGSSSAPLPCEGSTIGDGGNRTLLDLDDDGRVNLTDTVYLLSYLFQRGPAPALGEHCVRIEGCESACAR